MLEDLLNVQSATGELSSRRARPPQDLSDYRALYDNLQVGLYRSTIAGKQISANPALVQMNGFSSEAEMLAAVNDIAGEWYVEPGRRFEFMEELARNGVVTNFVSEIYRYKSRQRIWITETARIVYDEASGEPLFYEGTVQEITETQQRLATGELFRKFSQEVPGCLYQYRMRPDGSTCFPFATGGLKDLFGFDPENAMTDDRAMWSMIHPDDLENVWTSLRKSAADLVDWSHEFRIIAKDGSIKWIHENASPEREPDGSILWHGFMNEITERKQSEVRIHRMAYYDLLTGLPNRKLLLDRLDQALAEMRGKARDTALLFVDLDGFKEVNDAYGHEVGDDLLRAAAARFESLTDGSGLVARLGGDEFAIMLQGLDAARAAVSLAQDINGFFAEPMIFGGRVAAVGASIGIAKASDSVDGASELLRCADLAMYSAKLSGRNRFCIYDKSLDREREEKRRIASDLRTILLEEALRVVYQPIIDARTGEICGAEALLRWPENRGEIVPPDVFVPIAEQCGLIDSLGSFVLKEACRQAAAWPGIAISVNVSPLQLMNPAFPSQVAAIVDGSGLERGRLELEITESFIVDNARRAAVVIAELRLQNITISLDDFGSGFSSIGHIRRFKFDRIKIDRSMVSGIADRPSALKLLQATIAMAHALDLEVTVEGVEKEEEVPLLRLAGCHQMQGFLFSRPVSASVLKSLLNKAGTVNPQRVLSA